MLYFNVRAQRALRHGSIVFPRCNSLFSSYSEFNKQPNFEVVIEATLTTDVILTILTNRGLRLHNTSPEVSRTLALEARNINVEETGRSSILRYRWPCTGKLRFLVLYLVRVREMQVNQLLKPSLQARPLDAPHVAASAAHLEKLICPRAINAFGLETRAVRSANAAGRGGPLRSWRGK